LKIGPARRAANDDPVADASGEVAGGYPNPVPILLTRTSPSSAPAETTNVIDPDDEAAETTPVAADVADADPAEFDAVTTTCIVEPTSADDNRYVA
jgi:hypothetical protein